MARRLRLVPDSSILHVINRGNERRALFTGAADYAQFLGILDRTRERVPLDLYGYVLMPNHWHLVVRTDTAKTLSKFMHRLTGMHAVVLRKQSQTTGLGHIYQDRYRAWVIDQTIGYVRVLRYVEANPVRAGLVEHAENWRWSSLHERVSGSRRIAQGPVSLPPVHAWIAMVNRAGRNAESDSELA